MNTQPGPQENIFVSVNGFIIHHNLFDVDGDTITFTASESYPVEIGDTVEVTVFRPYIQFEKHPLLSEVITTYHDGTNGYMVNTASGDLYIDTIHPTLGIEGGCIRSHGKIYNAVWNDYADCWYIKEGTEVEPGYCYADYGEGLELPRKKGDPCVVGICSDTFGHSMGHGEGKAPIAVAGFVLAYVDKQYSAGTYLTNNSSGILTKASLFDIILNRCVAQYLKPEPNDIFNKIVPVRGRHWVKVL